ncbi:hypothetical protein RF11_10105 [Thelohanellus kitauei]|uniref:MD-2-related lipid-recognition domain-containing protein n=1 Tax=Thelohanellus kitauei TaxID=669202 RepID=A0A0C2MBW2_THEKT|nr:hypothetical protein RF11_10105 [Thelohanellus kitauei]
MEGYMMKARYVNLLLVLTIIGSILKLTEEQAYQCGATVCMRFLTLVDSSFLLKAVSVTGCTAVDCRHYDNKRQTIVVSFIPFSKSETVRVSAFTTKPDFTYEDVEVEEQDFCEQEGMRCPVYPMVEYTLKLTMRVSDLTRHDDIWTTIKLLGDEDKILFCVKVLSAKLDSAPHVPFA